MFEIIHELPWLRNKPCGKRTEYPGHNAPGQDRIPHGQNATPPGQNAP